MADAPAAGFARQGTRKRAVLLGCRLVGSARAKPPPLGGWWFTTEEATPESGDKDRLRTIFLRLTRLDSDLAAESPRDTRQRVAQDDLMPAGVDPTPTFALVARLVITGVGPTGEKTVEVAHEALIRS